MLSKLENCLNLKKTNTSFRVFSSFIIILSGIMLHSDKIASINVDGCMGFNDCDTFTWVLFQSISPLLLILGAFLKPYKISYLGVIYFYFIQLYWVFDPEMKFDNILFQVYATGTVICFCVFVIYISNLVNFKDKEYQLKQEFIKNTNSAIGNFKTDIFKDVK